ncbi:hypothetical protein Dform_01841 [Dehalogenimonas formicexedens]|uniref:Fibronectin type-III domain-containing protein n=1 Tax=Dehalogenimonas formicexedens TaxID=1839801 RepID=A0A1P8F9P8_9CHLR|nr:fibronectin type III domain-containing protein [Dehalogenimonas formicexedens]APV45160.1 hypothetical protein Dform_01841 [Dehalogenimonas formicexedens]
MAHIKRWLYPVLSMVLILTAVSCGAQVTPPAVTTSPPEPIPAAPSDLVVKIIDPNKINIRWADNSVNEIGFRLERSTDLNFTKDVVVTNLTFNFTDLTEPAFNLVAAALDHPVTTYFYRVYARGESGDSLPSNIATDWQVFYSFKGTQFVYARLVSLATSPAAMNYVATYWKGVNWYDISGNSQQGRVNIGWQYRYVCVPWQEADWTVYPDGRMIPGASGLRLEAEIAKMNRGETLPYQWQGAK